MRFSSSGRGGWAELAEGVTDESYVDAAASARRRKAGIWGDGPP
jgi:endonuclease YncB( thermonuclease family)